MCNFTKPEEKSEKSIIDDEWAINDRCTRCGILYALCDCRKDQTRERTIDIYGPEYPPC